MDMPRRPSRHEVDKQLEAQHKFTTQLSTALERTAQEGNPRKDDKLAIIGLDPDHLHLPVPRSNDESKCPPTPFIVDFPTRNAWADLFYQEIAHNKFLEAQMLALTVATGIVDAMTYTTYRVFVSKQTGNTLFIALYAIGHPSIQGLEKNVVISLIVFLLGAAFFGHLGHQVKQRRRIWLIISNFFQTALVYAAAALRYWGDKGVDNGQALGVLTLLSFACGGQIALALNVGLPELNTTMITGALIQLATDVKLLSLHNVARNRRVLFFLSLLMGCFIGSAATTYSQPALALLLMAIVKTVVGVSFFFNHGVSRGKNGDSEGGPGTHTPFLQVLWGD